MNMLIFFVKKAFSGCKSQIFVNGYRIDGRETEFDSLSDAPPLPLPRYKAQLPYHLFLYVILT